MKDCCKQAQEQDRNFCPKCGTKLNESAPQAEQSRPVTISLQASYCPNCHEEIDSWQEYCGSCGTKYRWNVEDHFGSAD